MNNSFPHFFQFVILTRFAIWRYITYIVGKTPLNKLGNNQHIDLNDMKIIVSHA
jgi:hypothetical protein